jgi:hypothetical protein
MIGSLTVLPFPCAPSGPKVIEPPPPPSPILEAIEEPLRIPEAIEDLIPEAYVPVQSLPRTDDLCHQDLQLITLGTFAISIILCSVLLNALLRTY